MPDDQTELENYYELSYYTLAHQDPSFIHQHVVDAFAAQTAGEDSKSIGIAFALIGLYLYLEKGYTGKQVQLAHMSLANRNKEWPRFALPKFRGEVTITDVLKAPPGEKRDTKIRDWCLSVWQAYEDSHGKIADLVSTYLDERQIKRTP